MDTIHVGGDNNAERLAQIRNATAKVRAAERPSGRRAGGAGGAHGVGRRGLDGAARARRDLYARHRRRAGRGAHRPRAPARSPCESPAQGLGCRGGRGDCPPAVRALRDSVRRAPRRCGRARGRRRRKRRERRPPRPLRRRRRAGQRAVRRGRLPPLGGADPDRAHRRRPRRDLLYERDPRDGRRRALVDPAPAQPDRAPAARQDPRRALRAAAHARHRLARGRDQRRYPLPARVRAPRGPARRKEAQPAPGREPCHHL